MDCECWLLHRLDLHPFGGGGSGGGGVVLWGRKGGGVGKSRRLQIFFFSCFTDMLDICVRVEKKKL